MPLRDQLQRDVLDGLERLGVKARQAVENVLAGRHRSVRRGLSVEFVGHRPYQPGDDLRHLDWLVYARSDRYDVRLYEEETRLRATIVLDASGSMGYAGSGAKSGMTKLHYGRMLAGALAFLMTRQSDTVGLVTCDRQIRAEVPPGSTVPHLLHLLGTLEDTQTGGETGIADVLQTVAARIRGRGMVVLITDALDDPAEIVQAVRLLKFAGQDVRLFRVVDPDEELFPHAGMTEFVGLEDEPKLRLDADRMRALYRQAFAEHRRALEEGCQSVGVEIVHCRTDEDLAGVLVRALMQQPVARGRRR